MHGEIQDPLLYKFLERLRQKAQETFDTADFITLDLIDQEKNLLDSAKSRLLKLRKSVAIELTGRKIYSVSPVPRINSVLTEIIDNSEFDW